MKLRVAAPDFYWHALTGDNPWTVVSALFAGMFGDCTIEA
jgi:hypothetical protein